MSRAHTGRDLTNPALEKILHLDREHIGATGDGCGLGNDPDRMSGMKLSHSDHGRLERIYLAGDDVLQVGDDLRADGDRVDGSVGATNVSPSAVDLDSEDIARGHQTPGANRDVADWLTRPQMEADDAIDAGHHARLHPMPAAPPRKCLLTVLEQEPDGARGALSEAWRAR